MRLSLLALAAAGTVLAAPHLIDIETQQVILGCDHDMHSVSKGLSSDDYMLDAGFDRNLDDEINPEYVYAEFDTGLIDGVGWDNSKQFIAYVHSDGSVRARYYEKSWQPSNDFYNIGGKMDRTLSVFSIKNTVYIAGVSTSGHLLLKYFRDGNFSPRANTWFFLDDDFAGRPAMATHDNNTLSIVARSKAGPLYHFTYNIDDGSQTYAQKIGGDTKFIKNPVLVSRSPGSLTVLAYDNAATTGLQYVDWDGKWGSYQTAFTSWPRGSPVAIAKDGVLDFFGVGNGNIIYKGVYDGKKWSSLRSVGSDVVQTPAALYYGTGSDVYYHTSNTIMQGRFNKDGSTSGPYNIDGVFRAAPVVFSWGNNRVDVWGIGGNGGVYQKYYDGSWSSWTPFGGSAKL